MAVVLVLIRLDIVFFFLEVTGMNRVTSVSDFGFLPIGCTAFDCPRFDRDCGGGLTGNRSFRVRSASVPISLQSLRLRTTLLSATFTRSLGQFAKNNLVLAKWRRLTFPSGTGIVK